MPSLGIGADEGAQAAIEADLTAGVLCDVWFLDAAAAKGVGLSPFRSTPVLPPSACVGVCVCVCVCCLCLCLCLSLSR